jgi:hypothetical protein
MESTPKVTFYYIPKESLISKRFSATITISKRIFASKTKI